MTEIPLKKQTFDIKDQIVKDHIDSIQDNFQLTAIELTDAPAATAPLIESGQSGIYSNSLYYRVGNTIYVFASDSQITVT